MKTLLLALALIVLGCGASHGGSDGGPDAAVVGTDCDHRHALCDAPPPTCPPSFTASVEGTCWGPCVPIPECAPIPCDPESTDPQCPPDWGCVGDGMCAPPL